MNYRYEYNVLHDFKFIFTCLKGHIWKDCIKDVMYIADTNEKYMSIFWNVTFTIYRPNKYSDIFNP